MPIDFLHHNRLAWDRLVSLGDRWTVPVTAKQVERARSGNLELLLTPSKPVPLEWLTPLRARAVLGLAAAGGQQAPLLAAAGANVTVLDNSSAQLGQDRLVAEREGLAIHTVQGDMRDLSAFADESFDMIFHPCSNCFVPDVLTVWRECWRVLRRDGVLLAGFVNPVAFSLDRTLKAKGIVQLRYPIPYSDLDYLDDPEIRAGINAGDPVSFGHTLQDQIAGQLSAGFAMTGFFEDRWHDTGEPLDRLMDSFIATRCVKQRSRA